MIRVMIFEKTRTSVRFCRLARSGLVILLIFAAATGVSAQIFEEIPVSADPLPDGPVVAIHDHQAETTVPKRLVPTESFVLQPPLPAVATPDDARTQPKTSGVIPAFGDTTQNGVVLAQFQEDVTWSSGQTVTLPSVRLAQGHVPKVASIEKPLPQTSPYRGPGRIIMGESDGMTPSMTTRPPVMPEPSPLMNHQRSPMGSGIVNAYPQPDEGPWDHTKTTQEYEAYETLPGQLGYGYSSAYSTQEQYGMPESGVLYGSPYGGVYGNALIDGTYAVNGDYGYGQGVYGYGYGAYPGYGQPTHGLVSGVFSHILCSNLWENLTIGFGGASFKSPLDFQNGGAFGFTETLNWASPSTSRFPVRLQAGVRAVQAYPSGWRDDFGIWQRNGREQYFGTVGVFKRNLHCSPLNFGVAYDVMFDRYYDKYRLEQLRAELSYGSMYGVEFGYRGAFGLRNDSLWLHRQRAGVQAGVQVVDYHTLFLKKYFANGGEGSLAGGATEYGDAMVRAEYCIPLSNEWGLKNSLSYIIPRAGRSPASPSRESWDISLQLVYQPQGGMLAGFCNPFRSFFDVADNGTLIQRFR